MRRRSRLPRRTRPFLNDLPRRAYLTVQYHGWGDLLFRIATSPLRLVGLERRVRERRRARIDARRLRRWYREHGRPVTVVVPTYGPPDTTIDAAGRLRRSVDAARTRIVVVDDGSPAEHQARLRAALEGVELLLGEDNAGFAASVNRGIRTAAPDHDVVVLNNDVVPHDLWLEALQRAAYRSERTGAVGPKLLYPDGRIQSAGSYRNLGAPEWFDHRYRFRPRDHGPAGVSAPALAMTGACLYLKRRLIDEVGLLDEAFPMGYEDVDLCLRAWEAGYRVEYEPSSVMTHVESTTRGMEVGARERESQQRFWSKWGEWFDERRVRTPEGALRIVYVTEDTGVGGGHRDVFEHLNRLQERGHSVELYSLGGQPGWFPLRAPVRSFESFEALEEALASEEALKVATWWRTAPHVWRASVTRGVPVYLVQDIEASYYEGDEQMRNRVLASYREEFRYMTISRWNEERLRELGLDADLVPPGIDLETFRPLPGAERRDDVVLAVGRSLPLKNLPLTVDSWRALDPRPELWMFGVEPELGEKHGARYIESPSDREVNELLNTAAVFVQTSRHEGFCLPLLEAMAAGTPVVCTDADGNRDFCRDGENCLMVEDDPAEVSRALACVLADRELRRRLSEAGLRTARGYAWERRIDQVEKFLERAAAGDLGRSGPAGDGVARGGPAPGAARAPSA